MIGFLQTAYNLSIRSEIALPELLPLADQCTGGEPDVVIRLGKVNADGLPKGRQCGPFLWADLNVLWLRVPKIARFLVRDGCEVTVDPEPGSDEASVRIFLLGSIFGALLLQRGLLVLHGNAVRIGDSCMICVGESGAGKSSLAAGFIQRGYAILADDVVSVDINGFALPGYPRIKLWRDTADHLGIDTRNLQRVRPDLDKFNYPVPERFTHQALPVRWIYVLGSDHTDHVRVVPIQGMQRFAPLSIHSYRPSMLKGLNLRVEHLGLCGRLAAQVHMANIIRPRQGFELDQLIDRLLLDTAEHP